MENSDFIFGILVILPVILLIHEFGHISFVKFYGGKITNLTLGNGKKILSVGIFDIRIFYFLSGKFTYDNLKVATKTSKAFILLGGLIFNIISIICAYWTAYIFNIHNNIIINLFLQYSIIFTILNSLPIKLNKMNTDGKQLYQLLKFGSSSLYDN